MTIIENFTKKPDINEYMARVFEFHLNNIIKENRKENLIEDCQKLFTDYRNKIARGDLEFDNFKDIFGDYEFLNLLEDQKLILNRLEDNKIAEDIKKEINEKIDEKVKNKYNSLLKKLDGKYSYLYKNLEEIKSDLEKNIELFNAFFINAPYLDFDKISSINLKIDNLNIFTFDISVSREIYSGKIFKYKWNGNEPGVLLKNIKDYRGNVNQLDLFDKVTCGYFVDRNFSGYKIIKENFLHNLDSRSKDFLNRYTDLFEAMIEYQCFIKSNVKTEQIIDKIKGDNKIRKVQLEFESSEESKYDLIPMPKHLTEKFN